MNFLFRTDASTAIGLGHVMRCIALAQAARTAGHSCVFAMAPGASAMEHRLQEEGCNVVNIVAQPGSKEDATESVEIARKQAVDWIIVDGYQFNGAYQEVIRKGKVPFLFVDDYGHGAPYKANLILNQNSYAPRHTDWYVERPSSAQLLLGSPYTMLRREFLTVPQKEEAPAVTTYVLLTLGGGDPRNATLRITEALKLIEDIPLEVTVVVGGANLHLPEINAASGNMHIVVDTTEMPALMAQADLAIAASGTTAYELAFLGIPTILCVLAQNQQMVGDDLKARQVADLLGDPFVHTPAEIAQRIRAIALDRTRRATYTRNSRALIDGQGSSRVLSALLASH